DGASRCRWRQRRDGVLLFAAPEERPGPQALADPRGAPDRDHYLDRADLSPPPQAGPPGPIDPHRIRDHHEPGREPRGLTPQLSPDRAAVPTEWDTDEVPSPGLVGLRAADAQEQAGVLARDVVRGEGCDL